MLLILVLSLVVVVALSLITILTNTLKNFQVSPTAARTATRESGSKFEKQKNKTVETARICESAIESYFKKVETVVKEQGKNHTC